MSGIIIDPNEPYRKDDVPSLVHQALQAFAADIDQLGQFATTLSMQLGVITHLLVEKKILTSQELQEKFEIIQKDVAAQMQKAMRQQEEEETSLGDIEF